MCKKSIMMKYLRLLTLMIIPLMLLSCNKDKNNPGYAYMGNRDMYYTKYYKAYSPNPILRDSMTNQMPPPGTVARSHMPFPYPGKSISDRAVNQTLAGLQLVNPMAGDQNSLDEGKQLYTIFCVSCHGDQGRGDGYLFTSGLFPAKPMSLVENFVKSKPDGELYYVITYGSISGLMGPHGSQIPQDKRWMIINYVRSLSN
jgi:mono/diheme cytochrome c family protein